MFMATTFWGMDIAENKGWIALGPALTALKEVKVLIARILFGVTLFAANYAWYRGALCVKIEFFNDSNNSGKKVQARILGYSNIYGSTLFLVLINLFWRLSDCLQTFGWCVIVASAGSDFGSLRNFRLK